MKSNTFLSLTMDKEKNVIIHKNRFFLEAKDKYQFTQCPICLNDFGDNKEELILLLCGHKFCLVCLETDRKKNKAKMYRCPECRQEWKKGFIVDQDNKIKRFMKIGMNEAMEKTAECSKCLTEIKTDYFIKCEKCPIAYHGYCIIYI